VLYLEIRDFGSDEADLLCVACGEPNLEFTQDTPSRLIKVRCRCVRERIHQIEDSRRKIRVNQLRHDGGLDVPMYTNMTFENDNGNNPCVANVCRNYVSNWQEMYKNGVGYIFVGPPSVGKTFFSGCILNALVEQEVSVFVTNFPKLLRIIKSTKWGDDQHAIFNQIMTYDLMLLDDLGVEYTSDFALEQLYSVIDARCQSCKPFMVTTNIDLEDMTSPKLDVARERIYSRILNKCIPIVVEGESQRIINGREMFSKYEDLLGLDF